MITNNEANSLVNGTAVADVISNTGAGTTLNGGGGADSVYNAGSGSVILGDGGNDTIQNDGGDVSIDGGADNDYIQNSGNTSTLLGGTGDDTIDNEWGINAVIHGDAGNDYIKSSGAAPTIDGGTGNDTIQNYFGSNASLNGGDGNDVIHSNYSEVTAVGGAGDDLISLGGNYNVIEYADGGGNDTVIGFNNTDTLRVTDGTSYTTVQSGANIIARIGDGTITFKSAIGKTINVEGAEYALMVSNEVADTMLTATKGNDSLINYAANVTIDGGGGKDTIQNSGVGVMLGGEGNDTIINTAAKATLLGGADNDYIQNSGSNAIVDGGDGNDYLENSGGGSSLNGGNGDDYIFNKTTGATIGGGTGNDTIDVGENIGGVAEYSGGHDFLLNFNEDDTLKLVSGSIDDFSTNENDLILQLGSGTLTIHEGLGRRINIIDQSGNFTSDYVGPASIIAITSNELITGTDYNDTLTASSSRLTLNAGAGNDFITGGGQYNKIDAGANDDTIANNGTHATIGGGEGADYITNTGVNSYIEGGAGADSIENDAESVVIYAGSDSDSIKNTARSATIGGDDGADYIANTGANSAIYGGAGNDSIENDAENVAINGGGDSDSIKNAARNATIGGDEGADYITNTGANSAIYGGAGNDSIENDAENVAINGGSDSDSIKNTARNATIGGGDGNDSITNTGANSYIEGNAGNDSIYNSAQNATLVGGDGNDYLTNEGQNALVLLSSGNDTINLSTGSGKVRCSGGNGVIVGNNEQNTVELAGSSISEYGFAGDDVVLTLGSGTLTFKNARGQLLNFGQIRRAYGATAIENTVDNIRIETSRYFDTITNSGANVTITSGDGNDQLANGGSRVLIESGDGTDSISNSGAGSTINGGTDNDTLTNSGNDAALLGGDGMDSISNSGSNAYIDGGSDRDLISNDANGANIYGGLDDDTIRNRGNAVQLSGGAGNDSIENEGMNVTLEGGAGDDTIDAGAGSGVIRYNSGGGDDVVLNYSDKNRLELNGADYSTLVSGGDVIVSIGSGSVLLKDAANRTLAIGGNYINDVATINNTVENTEVVGNDGRDVIITSGRNVTVRSGGGNDTITGSDYGELFAFGSVDGSNVITNFGANDTLRVLDGVIESTATGGDDYLVRYAGGTVTLQGAAHYDFVLNGGILAVDNDEVATIDYNYITNASNSLRVVGTENRDWIVNTGSNVTIRGNGGDDVIEGSDAFGEVFLFNASDGNDTIKNFGQKDTLQIITGSITKSATVGNDLIVTVTSGRDVGTVLLKDVINKDVTIKGMDVFLEPINDINNDKDNVKISGTTGRDYIINTGEGVTIQSNEGNDTIESSRFGELFLFSGQDDRNLILNFDKDDTLQALSSTLKSYKASGDNLLVTIKGSSASSVITIEGGAQYDWKKSGNSLTIDYITTIASSHDGEKITGTGGRDFIINTREHVTIDGGKGNDTIEGSDYGEVYLFSGSDGNDLITEFGENDTLKWSSSSIKSSVVSGDDVVVKFKSGGVVTLGGAAKFTDWKFGSKVLAIDYITTVTSSKDGQKLSGTGGRNYIVNTNENMTIDGNGGNDTLTGCDFGELYLFGSPEGNDVITNFGKNDSIKIVSGEVQAPAISGNDVIINVPNSNYSGAITLQGAADYKFILQDNLLTVDNTNYIVNDKDKKKIKGTTGKDHITNTGENVTIESGKGNDTLVGSTHGEIYLFASNGGNDIITNFGKNDTLRYTSGSLGALTKVNDDDYVVSLSGGTVTLKDTGSYVFKKNGKNLTAARYDTISNEDDKVKVSGTGEDDSITNDGAGVTIQSGAGSDTIVGSEEYGEVFAFSYMDESNLIKNFGKGDSLVMTSGKTMTTTTSGKDVIVTLTKSKTSAMITLQGTAGYDFVKSGNTLTIDYVETIRNGADGKKITGTGERDWIINTGDRVTIQPGKGNDTITGSDQYKELYNFAYTHGNNVITNFGKGDSLRMTSGKSLTYATVGNDVMVSLTSGTTTGTVKLLDASDLVLKKSGSYLVAETYTRMENNDDGVKVSGTSENDLIINSGDHVTIQPGKGSDTIEGSDFGEMYLFSYADGDNVITNFGRQDTLRTTSSSTKLLVDTVGADVTVTLKGSKTSGTVTLQGASGYKFVQASRTLTIKKINEVYNSADGKKVKGSSDDDWIMNSGANVTVQAGKGDDTIEGSDFGEVFLFSYTDGANVIENFGANDTLQMNSGKTLTYKTVGSDMVVTIASGSTKSTVTLLGAAEYEFKKDGKYLTVANVNNIVNDKDSKKVTGTSGADYIVNTGEHVTIQSGKGDDTIVGNDYGELFNFAYTYGNNVITNFGVNDTLKATSGTLTYKKSGNDMVVSIKKSKTTATILLQDTSNYFFVQNGNVLTVDAVTALNNDDDGKKFKGTSGRDYITNTGQNVTITGGKGDDTMEGSDFGEVYSYAAGDGNDVITNFDTKDTLRISSGTIGSYYASGNDYVIEVQSGTATGKITLQNVSSVKVSGKKITAKSVSAELPSSSEDYWFMTDETNDELGVLLDDATLDNAIGMLESDSAISLGSARIDQITTIAKHQSKK